MQRPENLCRTLPTGLVNPVDPKHAFDPATGKNLVRVPCPPPTTGGGLVPPNTPVKQTSMIWNGGLGGVYFAGAFRPVTTVEESAAPGAVTHSFNDCRTGFGGGLNAGWEWQLPNDVVLVGAVDAYFPNDQVSHPFAGGTFPRSSVDFIADQALLALSVPIGTLLLRSLHIEDQGRP